MIIFQHKFLKSVIILGTKLIGFCQAPAPPLLLYSSWAEVQEFKMLKCSYNRVMRLLTEMCVL